MRSLPILIRSVCVAGWLMLDLEANAEPPQAVVQSANAAGLKLFVQAFPEGTNGSLAPLAVTSALAMLQPGAEGQTQEQLTTFLSGSGGPEVIPEYAALWQTLPIVPDDQNTLHLACTTGLWSQQGFPLSESFQQHLAEHWGLQVQPLDFREQLESSRASITDWYTAQDPRLNDISVAGISEQTRLYLATAASLEAPWFAKFNSTASGTFQVTPERTVPGEYMKLSLPTGYWESAGVKAVWIPFRSDRLGLVLVVPESTEVMARVAETLAKGSLPFELQSLEHQPVALEIVKFRQRFPSTDLRQALHACGVIDLFTREARLPRIGPNLSLESLQYGGEFSLDENGCRAAAATGLNVIIKAEPKTFKTDRPFLYFVMDKTSGLVLFVGRVQDPSIDPDWNAASQSL